MIGIWLVDWLVGSTNGLWVSVFRSVVPGIGGDVQASGGGGEGLSLTVKKQSSSERNRDRTSKILLPSPRCIHTHTDLMTP